MSQSKTAKANVPFIRQTTQYTCMAASLSACLRALGKDQTEADVNRIMGAGPLKGATWESLTGAAQYFGMRSTLVVPATLTQVKGWTDRGIPVVIAYNPEGRPWSHASVIYDVTGEGEDTMVHVMDPNIPDPDRHVRVYKKADFYKIWSEKVGDSIIIRRPACAIEREITPEGRPVMASLKKKAEASDCENDYRSGGLTYEEYVRCLKRFGEEPSGGGYSRSRGYGGGYGSRPARPPRPMDPKTTAKIEVINRLLARRPNPFLTSVRTQIQSGRSLSPKQNEAVLKFLQGGKPEDIVLFGGVPPKDEPTPKDEPNWKPMPNGGSKYVSDDLLVWVTETEGTETVRDRNIPTWAEMTNDGELFADGVPELVAQGREAERLLAQWQKQGWWPRPIKVKKWKVDVLHRPSGKAFEAVFDDKRVALAKAEEAIPKMLERRRPSWLVPADVSDLPRRGSP